MKACLTALMTWLVIAAAALAAPLSDDDPRIVDLGGDEEARTQAADELVEIGVPAIPALVATLDLQKTDDERTAAKMAYRTLMRIANRAADSANRADVANVIASELGKTHEVETHREICRLLSFVGGGEVADELAQTLAHPRVGPMGRFALVRIPAPEATTVLVDALLAAPDPDTKVGLINALGERGDPAGAAAVKAQIVSDDQSVREAAMDALARIPSDESVEALQSAIEREEPGAIGRLIRLGESLATAAKLEMARKALQPLVDEVDQLTDQQHVALIYAMAKAGARPVDPFFVKSFNDEDEAVQRATSRACIVMPGKQVNEDLCEILVKAGRNYRIIILEALLGRGGELTDAAADAIVSHIPTSEPAALHTLSVDAIIVFGIEKAVPVLINAMDNPNPKLREKTLEGLARVPGQQASRTIVEAIDDVDPGMQVRLTQVLGYRSDNVALDALLDLARHEKIFIRVAAYRALKNLRAPEAYDVLLEAVKTEKGPAQEEAGLALAGIGDKDLPGRLLEAYRQGDDHLKSGLISVLARQEHPEIGSLLFEAAKSEYEPLRHAAVVSMRRLATADVLMPLSEAMLSNSTELASDATESLLQVAGKVEQEDKSAAANMYLQVLNNTHVVDYLRRALEGIGRTADTSRRDVFNLLNKHLGAGPMVRDAAKVIVPFACALPEDDRKLAVDTLRRAIELSPGDDMTRKATECLQARGVEIDPAVAAGFITHWWLIGPYPNRDNEMYAKVYPPEEEIDLEAAYQVDGLQLQWEHYHTPCLSGIVDMEQVMAAKDDIGAYAYAEINVDEAQNVFLLIGSDDSVVVWVNGKRVFGWMGRRGLTVDEERAQASLAAGKNRVLIKILNSHAAWGFCMRVVGLDGRPVNFTQKTP